MTQFNIHNSAVEQINDRGNNYKLASAGEGARGTSDKVKILFLAANPKGSTPLRLDQEIREIHSRIRAAEFRDYFDLVSRWAVRPLDLLQALNEVKPHVVHFSGHGSRAVLAFEADDGTPKPVGEAALVQLFKAVTDNIRLVLLNACDSEAHARAISQVIECAVGMNVAIGDEAAIVFASTFYGALAFGRSVGQAFEQGRTALMLQGIPEENTPVLLARPGADALAVSLLDRVPLNPVLPPVAFEILTSAAAGNTPVSLGRHSAGVSVVAGQRQFGCGGDLEKAAHLEHAVTMLVQAGLLKPRGEALYYLSEPAYEAVRKLQGQSGSKFVQVKEQMPALLAEMKRDLQGEGGKFVREFFVTSKRHSLGGSSKSRFAYYEEDHEHLRGKIDVLENLGYVMDVTPNNTPIYRMTEEFVQLVLEHG